MIAWPSTLPSPTVQGYGEAFGDPRRWTQTEQGVPRARRRSSRVARNITATLVVTDETRATFDYFWSETTGEGAEQFLMPDKGRDALELLDEDGEVLTDENGDPLQQTENMRCLFGQGGPQHRALGAGVWEVSFPLVILP